ncbi:Pre-mRNA polyadenylation factor fip1 [Smittium mucronatum]|uniref:Pre-mRNA polyadenylation factor fip1 n=1 Tax=Smittium mucronatum TaxID=133383 RepID=A0A1R0GWW9_9FUNG|nr:Pre-mRNA polyadenylation factor fip1 [Smittium mucronatum]
MNDIIDDDEFLYGDTLNFPDKSNNEIGQLDSEILDFKEIPKEDELSESRIPQEKTDVPKPSTNVNQEEIQNLLEESNGNSISDNLELKNEVESEDHDSDEDNIEFILGDSVDSSMSKPNNLEVSIIEKVESGQSLEPKDDKVILSVEDGKLDLLSTPMLDNILLYDYDFGMGTEKPWRDPGSDITDYFNFGFTEQTWRIYCVKQKRLRERYNANSLTIDDRNSLLPPELAILKPEPMQNIPQQMLSNFPHNLQNMHGLQNPSMPMLGMGGMPMMHGMMPGMQNRMQQGMPLMMPPMGMGGIFNPSNIKQDGTPRLEEMPDGDKDVSDKFNEEQKQLTSSASDEKAPNSNIDTNDKTEPIQTPGETIRPGSSVETNPPIVDKNTSDKALSKPPNMDLHNIPPNFLPTGPLMNIGGMNRPMNQMMAGGHMGLPFGMGNMMAPMGHMQHMGGLGPIPGRPILHNFPGQLDGAMGFPGHNPQGMFVGGQQNMIRNQNNPNQEQSQNSMFNQADDKSNSGQNYQSKNRNIPGSQLGQQNSSSGNDSRNQVQSNKFGNNQNFGQRDYNNDDNRSMKSRNEDSHRFEGRSNNNSNSYNYDDGDSFDAERGRSTSVSGRMGKPRNQKYDAEDDDHGTTGGNDKTSERSKENARDKENLRDREREKDRDKSKRGGDSKETSVDSRPPRQSHHKKPSNEKPQNENNNETSSKQLKVFVT